MKLRAGKIKSNLEYDFESFLLEEFSDDLEYFVLQPKLSCSDCDDIESVTQNRDSPLSFLVKFKADVLSDPRTVKGGARGYVLPEEYVYTFEESESHFKSISKNHCNLLLDAEETKKMARDIYDNRERIQVFEGSAVMRYLVEARQQDDWKNLFIREDKKKWRKFLGRALKNKLNEDYGPIDPTSVRAAVEIDPDGYKKLVDELNELNGFDQKELKTLEKVGLI